MDPAVINKAIDEAVAECKAKGVHGKETTPFLLAKVKELTGGDSLDSNIQLVYQQCPRGLRHRLLPEQAGAAGMNVAVHSRPAGVARWRQRRHLWPVRRGQKHSAKKGRWRIPERTLLLLPLLGGSVGGILGMAAFHHKTRHWYFRVGLPVMFLLQAAAAVYLAAR